MKNNRNNKIKIILEYFKFKGEESYDSVIEDDDSSNLDRLYEKFIEMGLNV